MKHKEKVQLNDPFNIADTLEWIVMSTLINWKHIPKTKRQREAAQAQDLANIWHALQSIYRKLEGKKVQISINADPIEIEKLEIALSESVKLQSHYAELLNMHDGGERMTFKSADDWIRRLKECKAIK